MPVSTVYSPFPLPMRAARWLCAAALLLLAPGPTATVTAAAAAVPAHLRGQPDELHDLMRGMAPDNEGAWFSACLVQAPNATAAAAPYPRSMGARWTPS